MAKNPPASHFVPLHMHSETCPRCPGVSLIRSPDSSREIDFFECPSCRRHYARKQHGALTYRWLHPVTLALYGVIFHEDPVPHAKRIADSFAKDRRPEDLLAMVDEIELELEQPTVPVREALDNYATERKCREYLAAFVSHARSRLG